MISAGQLQPGPRTNRAGLSGSYRQITIDAVLTLCRWVPTYPCRVYLCSGTNADNWWRFWRSFRW